MDIFVNIIGWIGTSMIVSAYFLLTTNKLKSTHLRYEMLNFFGAIGVLIDSLYSEAYPSVGLQLVWITVTIIGVRKILTKKHSHK